MAQKRRTPLAGRLSDPRLAGCRLAGAECVAGWPVASELRGAQSRQSVTSVFERETFAVAAVRLPGQAASQADSPDDGRACPLRPIVLLARCAPI
ncbi:hypothetical protein [Xanthomonas sp. XNM01]|uniref:hypothetical protein n=1 Tax=Xanthomonas sp. XNM01 TaxID=2769289 RepID=UPI00177F4D62|nr:hypothetical protein [Xanthomonas sp. XNM01]MBD9368893.1 hypothetical protein [Xanthomonas sp. XNM01]